jgi:colanic acid/amylovoran biosynthesis protein
MPVQSTDRSPTVCLLGASLDVDNRGVLALGVSLAKLVDRALPGVRVVFLYGNETGGSRRIAGGVADLDVTVENCRMSPRSAPGRHIAVILLLALLYRVGVRGPARRNAWLRSVLNSHLVGEIRGGDSFSDIYGVRGFLVGCLPLLTVVILGRPFVMLPQTYGPFRNRTSRAVAGFLLRRAEELLTRDRNCIPLVAQLSGRVPKFCPDVAFTLEPVEPSTLPLSPSARLPQDREIIGVNISGLLYMGGYTGRNMFGLFGEYKALVDELVERLLSSTSATVLLVPHVFGSEQEEAACAAILATAHKKYAGRVFAISGPLTEREVKWAIGRTNFFVGSRMHACIAALSQGIPAVGLAYSDKFLGVFESAGVGDAIVDLRTASNAQVIRMTLDRFARKSEFAAELASKIPPIKEEVEETFRTLLATQWRTPHHRDAS